MPKKPKGNVFARLEEKSGKRLADEMDQESLEATQERFARFMQGKITWAELTRTSMAQLYALADLGYNLFEQAKYEEARKIFSGLAAFNPYDPYFHAVLGSIFAKQDQMDAALREYGLAIQLDAGDPQVFVNRAEVLISLGRLEEAIADLKRAIDADPQGDHPSSLRAKVLVEATNKILSEYLKKHQKA